MTHVQRTAARCGVVPSPRQVEPLADEKGMTMLGFMGLLVVQIPGTGGISLTSADTFWA